MTRSIIIIIEVNRRLQQCWIGSYAAISSDAKPVLAIKPHLPAVWMNKSIATGGSTSCLLSNHALAVAIALTLRMLSP
ncbi:hypothetical protein [Cohaesibacter celericrescens]|uniref:Uncharacterized protein n=1 Tax=Cohaesibacter celericrescens TaxID=2067669 RepID=A0A2N5XQ24_9HYPH|nr:hypothetical protein [Cohaesibacter celericrescens]PLW76593.1 hypothetical protein C0081_13880 [Cohaesibacter celericrescens]